MGNENQLMGINGDGITKINLWMHNIHNIWREAMVADWSHTPIIECSNHSPASNRRALMRL